MKEYHAVVQIFVVVQVSDEATPADVDNAVDEWLSETCPFEEMEIDYVDVSFCTAEEEIARMRNAPNN